MPFVVQKLVAETIVLRDRHRINFLSLISIIKLNRDQLEYIRQAKSRFYVDIQGYVT